MVAKAAKKHKDSDNGVKTAIESSPVPPSQPQRPKSKDTVESPRVLRPQPPVGVSSRTDVDIYRYSQGTGHRMAIQPLFGQRRGSGGVMRPPSTKKKVEKTEETVSSVDLDVVDDGDSPKGEKEDDKSTISEETSETNVAKSGGSNQEDGRTSSPTPEDCVGGSIKIEPDLRTLVDDNQGSAVTNESTALLTEVLGPPSLLKKLDISSCHEPFLQSEGPKLTWLRNIVESALTTTVSSSSIAACTSTPDLIVYKTLAKDLRTFGGRNVHITVLLSSRGDTHIACKLEGMSEETTIPITISNLDQSKLLRRDLPILTPKWASWIISRVSCDSKLTFYLDFSDTESEKRLCFSEPIYSSGKGLIVEMVALVTISSLLISIREADSNAKTTEVLLQADDLRRLAISLGKWSADGVDQEIAELFDDHIFLSQIVAKSNVVRLGMNCARFTNECDDSLFTCRYQASFPEVAVDVPASQNTLINAVIVDVPSYVQEALKENNFVGTVALLAQAYVENGILSTLRQFQQQEAVQLNVAACMEQAAAMDNEATFNERVEHNLEAAQMSKLREIAIVSIVDDMILDFIAYECRIELHTAKYSGGYDDHYASKVRAAYRMSTQKRSYEHKKHVRMRAAQMLQALQRGIIARRRYSELKVEREKYLFYGFRSSLYHATTNMKDPRLRAQELSKEAEHRRHAFLMHVIQGYVAENFTDEEFQVSVEVVRDLYNEYGVVVGCSMNFGDVVVSYLDCDSAQRKLSNSHVSAALLLGLRDQYDDTFGLSSSARRMQRAPETALAPPRWMLKTCLSFQQSNLDRLAGLRLTRKLAGRKSAHLVARDYRSVLASSFDSFDKCRAAWEMDIRTRLEQQRTLDTFSADELAQHCLDLLISSVKGGEQSALVRPLVVILIGVVVADWGIDPDPLFEALNLCGRHCHGKTAIRIVEDKFNQFAARMNEIHGKQSVLTIRKEISQELEDFEKLLALRCLNMAVDDAVTVPTSELLHVMLKGNLDEEYIRHGLSTVLPIASITEKHDLARKILYAFANASYGEAFNLICWSCLDVAENVTVEAARFLDKITRPIADNDVDKKTNHRSSDSLAARALYLLSGSQAVRFLQFLAKVAQFNKFIQKRVLAHLTPYSDKYEMHRLASAVCSLEDFSIVSKIFDGYFSIDSLQSSTALWTQYSTLFGEVRSIKAMNDMEKQI
ncbi:hypothetical protein V7S43_006524 [Phytophthora oleae]|uniref:Uncharacterized protein n=1 Tax=Phytophthora oleae TaxID=2107226 RepID=A0ABD3FRV7_9STRA